MFQLLSSLLDWLCTPQGSNLLRAGFSLSAVLGAKARILAAVMVVVYGVLAFH